MSDLMNKVKNMNKQVKILAIGGAVMFLIMLCSHLFYFGSMSLDVRYQYIYLEADFTGFQNAYLAHANAIKKILEEKQALLADEAREERWPATLAELDERMKKARELLKGRAAELYKNDRRGQADELLALIAQIRNLSETAKKQIADLHTRIDDVFFYKEERLKLLETAKRERELFEKGAPPPLAQKSKQAETDWPNKRFDLQTRLAKLQTLQKEGLDSCTYLEAEGGKPNRELDFVQFRKRAAVMQESAKKTRDMIKKSGDDIDALYYIETKILIDLMKINPGDPDPSAPAVKKDGQSVPKGQKAPTPVPTTPTTTPAPTPAPAGDPKATASGPPKLYFIKLKIVRIFKNGKKEIEEKWVNVKQEEFYDYLDHLEMAVESKGLGQFPEEADKIAQAPAYYYADNPEYGEWEEYSGDDDGGGGGEKGKKVKGKRWKFKSKYAYLAGLAWATKSITQKNHIDYKVAKAGRTPFTENNKYGTDSIKARARHAQSKFVSTAGYLTHRTERKVQLDSRRSSYSGSSSYSGGSTYRSSGSSYGGSSSRGYRSSGSSYRSGGK